MAVTRVPKAVVRVPKNDKIEKALAYRVMKLMLDSHSPKTEADSTRDLTAEGIAAVVNNEFGTKLNRQGVYRQFALALSFGFMRPVPPESLSYSKAIERRFEVPASTIHVVDAVGDRSNQDARIWMGDQVALRGAERVIDLVRKVSESQSTSKRHVTIGVGPGRATLEWTRHFAELLRHDVELPPLELIAITAGGDPNFPEFSPPAFFGLLPANKVKCIGLNAPTLVKAGELKNYVPGYSGLKEAWKRRDNQEIDIVVSSMGDAHDEHDLLNQLLKVDGLPVPKGACGNFQFRYYNETQPIIEEDDQLRPFTLFELSDFREMASNRNRHVVLLARTCSKCPTTRAKALRPLLKAKALRVWSEIVMDVPTADDLIINNPPIHPQGPA